MESWNGGAPRVFDRVATVRDDIYRIDKPGGTKWSEDIVFLLMRCLAMCPDARVNDDGRLAAGRPYGHDGSLEVAELCLAQPSLHHGHPLMRREEMAHVRCGQFDGLFEVVGIGVQPERDGPRRSRTRFQSRSWCYREEDQRYCSAPSQ